MSEEQKQEQEKNAPSTEEIIELEWEEVENIFNIRNAWLDADSRLSSLLLNLEKQKVVLLARSQELEALMYETGSNLRDQKEISDEVTYELKLPSAPGEKGYFVRKDSQFIAAAYYLLLHDKLKNRGENYVHNK